MMENKIYSIEEVETALSRVGINKKTLTIKDLENFFGDRGIDFRRRYVLSYGNDDKNIYWIPNPEYDTYFSGEFDNVILPHKKTVLWVSRTCIYGEIEDEVPLEKSPYKFKNT